MRTGRLRLERTGTSLAFQVDEGGGFRTIATREIAGADVVSVRAMVATGHKPVPIDLRFTHLEIRWDPGTKIVAAPAANQPIDAQRPPGKGSHGWLVAAAIIGTLVALSVGAMLFIVRRRTGNEDAMDPRSTESDEQS
jgi:hypothetical protein